MCSSRKLPLVIAAFVTLPSLLDAASITPIGILPGKSVSTVSGVSGDGRIVVGTATAQNGLSGQAFKWTAETGAVGLGFLPGGSTSIARAISRDGTTIVGDATSSAASIIGGTEAFRFRDGTMIGLHTPIFMDQAFAVSGDGSLVVDSNSSLRWTSSKGVEQNVVPYASFGVSDDGSVVVGRSSGFAAQRWTANGGTVNLPVPGPGSSVANAVSGDGAVAVGNRNNAACYWTPSDGFVNIGPAGVVSSALAVNHDGSVIVGRANIGSGGSTAAFVWTPRGGMQNLITFLSSQGVDLSGWLYKGQPSLVEATGVSADGRFVIGNGVKQGFLVDLQSAPVLSLLEQWRQSAFGSSANSGSGADAADPDHDGLPNLLEYALGSNPLQPASPPVLTTRLIGDRLMMTFNRIADPHLTYTVEAATSLLPANWSAIWSSTGVNNTAGQVDVADTATTASVGTRFLRLSVTY